MIPSENIPTHDVTLSYSQNDFHAYGCLSDFLLRFSTVPYNSNFLTQACILFLSGSFSQEIFVKIPPDFSWSCKLDGILKHTRNVAEDSIDHS